jgi:hypothetical protein
VLVGAHRARGQASLHWFFTAPTGFYGDRMAKPPNYKQEKKRREEAQKKANQEEQQRKAARKNEPVIPPQS